MSSLWIVGNGFDLWHRLPTSYDDFYEFAKTTLDCVEDYFSIEVGTRGPWSDFENALGTFAWREFYDMHNHIDVGAEDFRPSFIYGLEDELTETADEIVESIKAAFREWIYAIDLNGAVGRLSLPRDASFISFNYTSTLEDIYRIDSGQVVHLHGRVVSDGDLVFGHGEAMEEEPELDENGDSNRTMFSDAESAARHPFFALQKPVSKVLDEHKEFFDSLAHVTEVTVVGHSLNRIDLPYFRRIAEVASRANWRVCCYERSDEARVLEQLRCCGITRDQIRVCEYVNLQTGIP